MGLTDQPHKNPIVRKSKEGLWPIRGCHVDDDDDDDDDALHICCREVLL
jgi:hypothetical protein